MILKTNLVFRFSCIFIFVLLVLTAALYVCIRQKNPWQKRPDATIKQQQPVIEQQPIKQQPAIEEQLWQAAVKEQPVKQVLNGPTRRQMMSKDSYSSETIVFVYTGRWKFLRIQLPYLWRELRSNGGVIDRVWFMMLKYDNNTLRNLTEFTKKANGVYNKEIFSLHYVGYSPSAQPPKKVRYKLPYSEIFSHLIQHPHNSYFKLDDDIVYIHPGAFESIFEQEMSNCLIHFFNIAGHNWRCSLIHQHRGVYDGLNPKNLVFEYSPSARCGWRAANCGELTLRTFLHHYHNGSLDKYFFDIEYLTDGKRFSINAFLMNLNTFDMAAFLATDKMGWDDEKWWTVHYTRKTRRSNCVIGNALVVHFSYGVNIKKMLNRGLLQEFESIVQLNKNGFNMPSSLWHALGYN